MLVWVAILASSLAAATGDGTAGCEVGTIDGRDPVLLQHSILVNEKKREGGWFHRWEQELSVEFPMMDPERMERFVEESVIQERGTVIGTFIPTGTTYVSTHPDLSQTFVENFMGASRKPVHFKDPRSVNCSSVVFNTLCLSTMGDNDFWAHDIHFVNGYTYPMGPMSTHDLYTYVEDVLSPMDTWNDFMQQSTGYFVRNLTIMWHSFVEAGQNIWLTKSDEHGPYTIWATVPGGLVFTYTSFVLNPEVAAQAVLFRQACDPPSEKLFEMFVEDNSSWKDHTWPNPHDFLPFYSNVPVRDPEAEAHRFLDILNMSEDLTTWTVRQQEGCMAIKSPHSSVEYRFEVRAQMNRTRTKAFPFLFEDFAAYVARIHDSFQWQEWNAWGDYHHVILAGLGNMAEPFDDFVNFEKRLQQKGLPYIKKGRCQFETFFVTSEDQTAVYQFKLENQQKNKYKETFCDPEIPLCDVSDTFPAASEIYDWYFETAKTGITAPELFDVMQKRGFLPGIRGDELPQSISDYNLTEPFDFCAGTSTRFDNFFEGRFTCLDFGDLNLCTAV